MMRTPVSRFMARVSFSLRYKTLSRLTVDPFDADYVLVLHGGEVHRLKRRCPHRGAPLETAYFKNDALICPWHGCRFPLNRSDSGHEG